MAITLRGTPKAGAIDNGADVTLTFDTGGDAPQIGDVILVVGGCVKATGFTPGPSTGGYIELLTILFDGNAGYDPHMAVYYKIAAGSETSVVCKGNANVAASVGYLAYVLSGVDPDVIDAAITYIGANISDCFNGASIVTVTDGAWVLSVLGMLVNDATVTQPSGYTNLVNAAGAESTFPFSIMGATKEIASNGTEDPAAWTASTPPSGINFTIAIRPYVQEESVFLATSQNWQQVADMKIAVGGILNNVHEGWVVVDGNWKPFWPPT